MKVNSISTSPNFGSILGKRSRFSGIEYHKFRSSWHGPGFNNLYSMQSNVETGMPIWSPTYPDLIKSFNICI